MKVIGLCGGSGSGKGVVSSLFDRRGIPAIDTDTVYRELTSVDSPCNRVLSNEFGKEIISTDGSLNRKKLRTIVFTGDDSKLHLKKLNEITHKYILDETDLIDSLILDIKPLSLMPRPCLSQDLTRNAILSFRL